MRTHVQMLPKEGLGMDDETLPLFVLPMVLFPGELQ